MQNGNRPQLNFRKCLVKISYTWITSEKQNFKICAKWWYLIVYNLSSFSICLCQNTYKEEIITITTNGYKIKQIWVDKFEELLPIKYSILWS